MKEPIKDRIGDFMAGKGFYIVLFLCVAAIGISGYYLVSTMTTSGGDMPVAGAVQVTVTPPPAEHSVLPQKPAVSVRPKPAPTEMPKAAPTTRPSAPSKPAPTPAPARPAFSTWPVAGEVIRPYSMERLLYDETMGDWRTHEGMDLAAETGTEVLAVADGTVESVLQDDLLGMAVTLSHAGGMVSVYAGLTPGSGPEAGETVHAGEALGTVGESAIAESALGPHLHFVLRKDGAPVDPADYLPLS